MPSQKLEAGAVNLNQLFMGEKRFLAPIFQRWYVWGRDQLDKLWSDLDAVLDGEDTARFLGALVLQDQSSGLAFEPQVYWIVDGQQRLTTLFLLLFAITEEAEALNNQVLASGTLSGYLLNKQGAEANKPKVIPTNQDRQQFSDILQRAKTIAVNPPQPYGIPTGAMRDMYARILRELKRRVKLEGEDFLTHLAEAILTKLKFVQIVLSDEEDP